ncbi:MAG: hypothetical protein EXQ56_10745 [Acidobacteria bacterium]|nr:hypothetical protein [Acidobacteriota bacterium]
MSIWNRRARLLAFFAVACSIGLSALHADNDGVLTGVVKDNTGAPVVGAFVKIKNDARKLTFMVISQAQGKYSIDRLPYGKYTVQGIGGEVESKWTSVVDVAASKPGAADVALDTQRAPALAPAWPFELPGGGGGEAAMVRPGAAKPTLPDGAGKAIVEAKCLTCHDVARTINARADKARWTRIIEDMRGYAQGSSFAEDLTDAEEKVLFDYVSENFSNRGNAGRATPVPDVNARLPRRLMTGAEMRYVAVEFEMPDIKAEPHEVTVDTDGNGWITERVGGKLGKLHPKTYQYTVVNPPPVKTKTVRLNGIWAGPNNKIWFVDGGPSRRWLSLDSKSMEFTTYNLPKTKSGQVSGNTMRTHPNGTVWMNAIGTNTVWRLDPKTRQFDSWEVPTGVKLGRSASPYGIAIDGAGYVWVMLNAVNKMGRVHPVTGHIDEYDIPVPNSFPRKAGFDAHGDIWVGLHGAGKLMKIDHKTTKFTVFSPPTEDSGVYAASVDHKNDIVWIAQQHVDKIASFDPKTEKFVEYPLAQAEEDHRRLEVDQNNPKRIWWSGNLTGRIGYIELLD